MSLTEKYYEVEERLKENQKILELTIESQFHNLIFECLRKKASLEGKTLCYCELDKAKVDEIIEKIKELLL